MITWFRRRINNQKGFTLIELIVVIAIIAILTGIAVPSFNAFTASAKERADMASLRTLNQATMLYRIQNPAADPFSGAAGGEFTSADPEYENLMNTLTASNYLDKPVQPQAAGAGYIWSGDSGQWLYTKNVSTAVIAGSPAIPASAPVLTASAESSENLSDEGIESETNDTHVLSSEKDIASTVEFSVWAKDAPYYAGDTVFYKGQYYRAHKGSINKAPSNKNYWTPYST